MAGGAPRPAWSPLRPIGSYANSSRGGAAPRPCGRVLFGDDLVPMCPYPVAVNEDDLDPPVAGGSRPNRPHLLARLPGTPASLWHRSVRAENPVQLHRFHLHPRTHAQPEGSYHRGAAAAALQPAWRTVIKCWTPDRSKVVKTGVRMGAVGVVAHANCLSADTPGGWSASRGRAGLALEGVYGIALRLVLLPADRVSLTA
jgi:hypothetical protein